MSAKRLNKEVLSNYYQSCQDLADYFVNKYFGKDASEVYWVGDDVGGVLAINDYFFDMETMRNFIKYKYSKNDMFGYYDEKLKADTANITFINIANWKKLGKPKAQWN